MTENQFPGVWTWGILTSFKGAPWINTYTTKDLAELDRLAGGIAEPMFVSIHDIHEVFAQVSVITHRESLGCTYVIPLDDVGHRFIEDFEGDLRLLTPKEYLRLIGFYDGEIESDIDGFWEPMTRGTLHPEIFGYSGKRFLLVFPDTIKAGSDVSDPPADSFYWLYEETWRLVSGDSRKTEASFFDWNRFWDLVGGDENIDLVVAVMPDGRSGIYDTKRVPYDDTDFTKSVMENITLCKHVHNTYNEALRDLPALLSEGETWGVGKPSNTEKTDTQTFGQIPRILYKEMIHRLNGIENGRWVKLVASMMDDAGVLDPKQFTSELDNFDD